MPDLLIKNCGSVALLVPATPLGQDWIAHNLDAEPWQVYGDGVAVEPGCVEAIRGGAETDGLEVA